MFVSCDRIIQILHFRPGRRRGSSLSGFHSIFDEIPGSENSSAELVSGDDNKSISFYVYTVLFTLARSRMVSLHLPGKPILKHSTPSSNQQLEELSVKRNNCNCIFRTNNRENLTTVVVIKATGFICNNYLQIFDEKYIK